MIKMVTLMPKKPGMTREDFIEYYQKRHVPLSFSSFPQIKKMVRNYSCTDNFHYIASASLPRVPFAAVVERWFTDQASFDDMMAQVASSPEKFRQLSEDEARFCDRERAIMFTVEEQQTRCAYD